MMDIIYPLLFLLVSSVVSLAANFLVLNFAKTLGIRNNNDVTIRWSNESKPSLGGISMYVVFLFTSIVIILLFNEVIQDNLISFIGLFIAATAGFGMGIADDAYDTKPFLKLAVQILCGFIFVFTDNLVEVTSIPMVNNALTVMWVVGLMNSLNMLDNMDGITTTTAIWVLVSCLLMHSIWNGWSLDIWTVLIISSIGTLLGFLYFNIHPSKMFMGDGGSQFIGVIIAFFTTKILLQNPLDLDFNLPGLIMVLTALTPAIVDTLTVVINRLSKGKSPMVGGKDHTTHHLVYSGKNDLQVWIVFLVLGCLSVFVTYFSYMLAETSFINAFFLGFGYFMVVFWFLYRNTLKFKIK